MLKDRGVTLIAPEDGDTACGEVGTGRLAESAVIISTLEARLAPPLPGPLQPLAGRHYAVMLKYKTLFCFQPLRNNERVV